MDASHAKWLRSVLGLHTGYLVRMAAIIKNDQAFTTKLLLLDSSLQETQFGGRELEYGSSLNQIELSLKRSLPIIMSHCLLLGVGT